MGVVAQCALNLSDREVQPPLEVYKSACAPYFLSELFAGNYLAGSAYKKNQDLGGLRLQFEVFTITTQLSILQIQLEGVETHQRPRF